VLNVDSFFFFANVDRMLNFCMRVQFASIIYDLLRGACSLAGLLWLGCLFDQTNMGLDLFGPLLLFLAPKRAWLLNEFVENYVSFFDQRRKKKRKVLSFSQLNTTQTISLRQQSNGPIPK